MVEKKALIGAPRREESVQALAVAADGEVTTLRIDGRGDDLFVGTSRGEVIRYDLRDKDKPERADSITAGRGADHAARFLNGDRSLVVGDRAGAREHVAGGPAAHRRRGAAHTHPRLHAGAPP